MKDAKVNVFESAIGLVEKTAEIMNFTKRFHGMEIIERIR